MIKISLIVDQIDHCKELIKKDEVSYLRIALLLLDNAAEILMHRKIQEEFAWDEFRKPLQESAQKYKIPLDEHISFPLTPDPIRKKIERFFDEKIKFLSEDRSFIDPSVAQVLKILHRYRNEAFHRDIIRKEIIKPATLVYFEIVCDLLGGLTPSSWSYSSTDNWESFYKRHNIKNTPSGFGIEFIQKITKNLKRQVGISPAKLKNILADHLLSRLEEAMEMIDFVKGGLWNPMGSLEEALKRIQWHQSGNTFKRPYNEDELKKFIPKVTLENFAQWKTEINKLAEHTNKLDLFKAFASIEESFEIIETQINEEAGQLDAAIQMEVDIRRGK